MVSRCLCHLCAARKPRSNWGSGQSFMIACLMSNSSQNTVKKMPATGHFTDHRFAVPLDPLPEGRKRAGNYRHAVLLGLSICERHRAADRWLPVLQRRAASVRQYENPTGIGVGCRHPRLRSQATMRPRGAELDAPYTVRRMPNNADDSKNGNRKKKSTVMMLAQASA